MTIGQRITRWRTSREISQQELARRIGVSAATLCRFEKDVRVPDAATVERIAKALALTMSGFYGRAREAKAS